MKKLFAISLLFIYLTSLTELSQLVKLPILIEHFIQHKEKDNSLSFWEFLDMHYAHGDVRDADYDQDMKLPFKSHNGCINTSIVALPSTNIGTLSAKPIYIEKKSYSIYTENFLSSSHLSSIWQPPKAC